MLFLPDVTPNSLLCQLVNLVGPFCKNWEGYGGMSDCTELVGLLTEKWCVRFSYRLF